MIDLTSVDLAAISSAIVTLSVIVGVIVSAYKLFDKHLFKRFNDHEVRLQKLESWTASQQEDIEVGSKERRLLLEGVSACLAGLKSLNCADEPVIKSYDAIQEFLHSKAHETKSRK